ncbi:hypothetical protein PAMP_021676 [Pampus punctatissimus]
MCESREVPSGKVYRQLFDAQVQLSRSLLVGRKDTRTLSAEHSNTHCSTASSEQQVEDDDDDVSRLPDTMVVDRLSSDIIEQLMQKKNKKHKEAVKQLDTELTALTQMCETQVRTVSMDLLSSLQDVDLRLDTLKDRMEQQEHVNLQEVCGVWEEVEEEVKLKNIRIMEFNHKLTECERQRINKVRAVLRTYFHLLEKISFQPSADNHRLIHSEATMLNQSVLANRRSAAHLLLLLQEENLQQESLLRLHWEDCLNRWKRSRVSQVVHRFRILCDTDVEQQLVSEQQTFQEIKQTQDQLTEQRCDIIYKISSLVPPSCSTTLVSDWFNQLTAANQQIDSLHTDFLHQLRCRCEQVWQDRLAEVQRCEELLSALHFSDEEVTDVISSQFLTLIRQRQRQDEERLATVDLWAESVSRAAARLSKCVFVVMRAAALLWEKYRHSVETREEEVQIQLDELRRSQEQHIQRMKVHLDDLLGGLRQEGSEDALRMSLDRTVRYLQDVKHSCSQCVSEQWELLDRLPSVFVEELLSYSSSLSSFYHLSSTYTLSPEELQNLHLPSSNTRNTSNIGNTSNANNLESSEAEEITEKHPISCQKDAKPTLPSQDWLAEAESSLLELCDISTYVTFTSSRGVAYTGPAFRCSTPNPPETHLNLFPVELLTHSLSRTRTLFLDHLEQCFHDVLGSAVATVTDRKEVVRLDQELQLQQLDPENIQTHIYLPRLAELQLHQQRVDDHCQLVVDMMASCRSELQQLQTSISRKNHEFTATMSNMEDAILTANCNQSLEALSSTLQDCVDHHIKQTQHSQTSFRRSVQVRLEDLRQRTTQLIDSFRLFSEGGDFAPQEVKVFQRRLKEETKQLSVTEESVYSQLEMFESNILQQVNEASGRFQDKLSLLQSELKFTEKIQKIISSTQVHIKAEAASCNQQQSEISSRLEDLKKMLDDTQVSPDQVCLFLSSVGGELRKRCHYLDFSLETVSLSARHKSRKQVQLVPPPGLLQTCTSGVDFLNDPAVGVVKSLNRVCVLPDESTEREQRGGTAAGQSSVQHLQQRSTESASGRRGCRSIRTERKFQIFGPKEDLNQNPDSFSSIMNLMLWKANDVLLLVAEEFYQCERCVLSRFRLVPDCLDQWAESMQQRLLGYQEQSRKFLSTSREDLMNQLCVLEEILCSLPSVLICNYEQQHEAALKQEVGRVSKKLEETIAASEMQKTLNVRQLRASLREDKLYSLISREEIRQQQLYSAVCCSHMDLQECVRVQGEEFVTSLASLTENLLHQLDHLITTEETEATSQKHSEDSAVTMETSSR